MSKRCVRSAGGSGAGWIVTGNFKEGSERNRALGLWAAMGGIGGSAGVLLGGALTQGFDWPGGGVGARMPGG